MFRKTTILLLCISMILSALIIFPANSSDATDLSVVLETLKEEKALVGDENGDLHLDDPVTRAEFCKMLYWASPMKYHCPSIAPLLGWDYAKEDDGTYFLVAEEPIVVRYIQWWLSYMGHPYSEQDWAGEPKWYWPYVINSFVYGLISGYPDGTVRPNANIAFEESVAIALRNMGYSTAALNGTWPNNVLDKANSLGLLQNVVTKPGESISRQDCAYLLYNMFGKEASLGPYTDSYYVDPKSGVRYSASMLRRLEIGRYYPDLEEGEEQQIQEFVAGIIADAKTDREKSEKIANWVATNMAYYYAGGILEDYWPDRIPGFERSDNKFYCSTKSPYINLYDSLVVAKDYPLIGICAYYTYLYSDLLRAADILSQYVDAVNINHAFNIVWLHDEQTFIFVDTTWMSSLRFFGDTFSKGDTIHSQWFDFDYGCDDRHTSRRPLLDIEH